MQEMPIWGWLWCGLALVAVVILGLLTKAAQHRLAAANEAAARLPDAIARAERAEKTLAELQRTSIESTAKEASLTAQLNESRKQLEQAGLSATRYEDLFLKSEERGNLLKQELASLEASLQVTKNQLTLVQGELDAARTQLRDIGVELKQVGEAHAKTLAEKNATQDLLGHTTKFLQDAQVQLKTAFTEAASKVFDEKSIVLDQRIRDSAEVSKKGFEETLKPFAERVGTFQTKIEQFTTDQAKEHATLVGTIGELKTLNQNMADATGALTKALKGNAKARGDWGELILDTVLKASGLEEGRDYERQTQSSDEDTGEKGRPDIVINLPDGRRVVVDSKVNLVAWSEAQNAETPDAQQDALFRHVAALRQHVRDLSDKNYPKILGNDTLDITVLFVPIEGALSAALTVNADLQIEAFSKKLVFASPNTLMAMLRVVERLWTRDKLQKQVDTIGTEAGKLMDSLIAFLDDFQSIEHRLKQAGDAYVTAKNRLCESPQSVMARGRRLVEAGVKGRKALPEELKPIAGSDSIPLIEQSEKDA